MMMFKVIKKIAAIALMSTLMLTLAACGEAPATTGGSGTTPGTADTTPTTPTTGESESPLIHNTALTGGNVGEVRLEGGDTYAIIDIRGFGAITVKLFPESAPIAVQNFIDLAESGYYTEKLMHRIIPEFMIQGGSPFGDGMGDPNGETFGVERSYNARHFYGALSMANAGGRNSQQFFIVNQKKPQTVSTEILSSYAPQFAQHDPVTFDAMIRLAESITDEMIEKYAETGGTPFLDGGYSVFGHTVDGFEVLDTVSKVTTGANNRPAQDVVIESVTIHTYEG
jgi:cyclophilin family peptidyl-prolyl cis-trans isomerase